MFEVNLWDGEIPGLLPEADTPNRMECHLLDGGKRPAVVVLPGGAYTHRAPHEGAPIAEFYNTRGFQGFVVHYRIKPYCYPAPLLDAQRAVRMIRARAEEWHVDPDRIFVLGFSAGGHLAAMMTSMPDVSRIGDGLDAYSPLPNGGILCYPVISLCEDFGHVGSGKNLLGDAYEEKKTELSAQNLVHDGTCPCFMWHTAEDNGVPLRNTFAFAEALRARNIPVEIHVYPHGRHGLGLAPDLPDVRTWAPLSADWIDRNF